MILMLHFFDDIAPPRPVKDLLEHGESIINPFHMRQLLLTCWNMVSNLA
jgi:hypothetical protein